jgi:hypothetical protein
MGLEHNARILQELLKLHCLWLVGRFILAVPIRPNSQDLPQTGTLLDDHLAQIFRLSHSWMLGFCRARREEEWGLRDNPKP